MVQQSEGEGRASSRESEAQVLVVWRADGPAGNNGVDDWGTICSFAILEQFFARTQPCVGREVFVEEQVVDCFVIAAHDSLLHSRPKVLGTYRV